MWPRVWYPSRPMRKDYGMEQKKPDIDNNRSKNRERDGDIISLRIFDSSFNNSERKRFCDICAVPILPPPHNLCPNCGRWYGDYDTKQGKHELRIKGMDGKSKHSSSNSPSVLVSMVKDKELPKSDESGKDKLPPSFKMMERKGMNITGWTDSSVTWSLVVMLYYF